MEGPDNDVPDTDSLVLLLQRDAGWTQNIGAVDTGVANTCGRLKAVSTRAQLGVPTTVEKVLHFSREALVSGDNVGRHFDVRGGGGCMRY